MTPTITTSPSTTALSDSDLVKKGLSDLVVNVADGCLHGCRFCFVPSMPAIWGDPGDKFDDAGIEDPAGDWGDYLLVREDLPQHLAQDCQRYLADDREWPCTRRGQGVVHMSISTDPYQTPAVAAVTRAAVMVLAGHWRPVRILTRKPHLAAERDAEFLAALAERDLVTVGASIPALDEAAVRALEPGAPTVERRLRGLERLADAGVPVYVSMSPTYPTQDREDLRRLLATLQDRLDPTVVFTEPINPRGANYEGCIEAAREAGQVNLARALADCQDPRVWIEYAFRHLRTVQDLGADLGQRVHLWPDERLTEQGSPAERAWAKAWRRRPTPETIGDGPAYREPYPDLPDQQAGLDAYQGGGTDA